MTNKGLVLSLFDVTGNMVGPWKEAGYETLCIDMARDGTDIRNWLPPLSEYRIVFAFPPCTDQAVSGSRWFKDKGLAGLASAIELVERARDICEWSKAPWMIENPVSMIPAIGENQITHSTRMILLDMSKMIITQKRLVCGLVTDSRCRNRTQITLHCIHQTTEYIMQHQDHSELLLEVLHRKVLQKQFSWRMKIQRKSWFDSVGSLAVSGDVTAAARVGSISPVSEPPLFRGVVTESLSAGVLHW